MKKLQNKRSILFLLLIFVVASAIWYFFFYPNKIKLTIHTDAPAYSDMDTLVNDASYIVVGKYSSFDTTWNMARDPNDASKESPDSYIEGRLYTFEIESVLKGEIEEEDITINLCYASQWDLNEEDTVLVPDLNYTEPEFGTTYILFLEKEDSPSYQGYYGVGTPFAMKLKEDGFAEIDRNLNTESAMEVHSSNEQIVTLEFDYNETNLNKFAADVAAMENSALLDQINDCLQSQTQ